MSNPIFTVDRRPAVHIAYGVSGGSDSYWGSSLDFCKPVLDVPGTGLRRAGVTTTSDIGVEQGINKMA